MTRAEHMTWCKNHALVYAKAGDGAGAIASMASDLDKHPETANLTSMIGFLMLTVKLDNPASVIRFVEGFL